MLVRATADLHGYLPDIEPCDLLLVCGDICPIDNHRISHQRKWLERVWLPYLKQVPAEEVCWIAGNHDLYLHRPWSWRTIEAIEKAVPNSHYLRDTGINVKGLNVWGSPWANPVGSGWAFMADEPLLRLHYAAMPDRNLDIVMSHGPPSGFGDKTSYGARVGSTSLTARIRQVEPRLAVYGHIHEGHGRWEFERTTLANVSYLDKRYRLKWPVQSFEL